MPRQRITPGSGLDPATGRVTGLADDTFNPYVGTAAKSRLDDLARNLRGVGEAGTSFYRQQAKRQDEEDAKRGQQALLEELEDQKNVADAVRSARMRPQASKWYRWGVESAAGGAAARRARDHFVSTKGEALEDAETLEEFDRLAGEAFDEYREQLGSVSEAFDNGFMPTYMAQLEELRYNFAVGIDGKLAGKFVDNFAANQFDQLGSAYAMGLGMSLASGGTVDPTETLGFNALAAGITHDLDAAARTNPGLEDKLKAATAKNLILMATRTRDSRFLDVAQGIRVGPEEQGDARPTLEGSFAAEFTKARQDVIDATRAERRAVAADQAVRRQQLAQSAAVDVSQILNGSSMANPETRERVNARIAELRRVAPLEAAAVENSVKGGTDFADDTIPQSFEELRYRLDSGNLTTGELYARRDELSYGDFNALMSQLDTRNRREENGDANEVMALEPVDYFSKAFVGRFEGVFKYIAEEKTAQREAEQIFRNTIVLKRDRLMALVEEHGVESPEVEAFVRQEYNDAINRATRQFQNNMQAGFAPPPPELPRDPIPEDELPMRFTRIEVATIGQYFANNTHKLDPSVWPSEVRAFARRWINLRPDAPVGSPEFDLLWRRILDAHGVEEGE